MILDADIKTQLSQYLQLMENDILLKVSAGDDNVSKDMLSLVDELATMSSKITVEKVELERTPSFSVNRPGENTGVVFGRYSIRTRIYIISVSFTTSKWTRSKKLNKN